LKDKNGSQHREFHYNGDIYSSKADLNLERTTFANGLETFTKKISVAFFMLNFS